VRFAACRSPGRSMAGGLEEMMAFALPTHIFKEGRKERRARG
jgi:hypothetical protein